MKRPNIHKYPWEVQEYIQHLEKENERVKEERSRFAKQRNGRDSTIKKQREQIKELRELNDVLRKGKRTLIESLEG